MDTASIRFTVPAVARLVCPAGKAEALFWDASLPGFGIRAYSSGKRVWVAQWRDAQGRTRRMGFGAVGIVKLDEARDAARTAIARAATGDDPQAAKLAARKSVRVSELVDAYLAAMESELRPRSFAESKRHLQKHAAPLHAEAAHGVGRAEIVRLLDRVAAASGPVAANRVRATLSACWVWGLRSGRVVGENPVANTPKRGETSRERVLTDAELALVWRCTDSGSDHDRIVRLLMLTAQRREEVGAMEWSEITGDLWTLPKERSKNGLAHEVPLSLLAVEQLPPKRKDRALVFGKSEGPFSGWSRCKERLDELMKATLREDFTKREGLEPEKEQATLTPWTLHDLRRTFATWANETGIEPHHVEAVLNHVSGAAKAGVAGTYNRASYRDGKRAALLRWEAHIRALAAVPEELSRVAATKAA